MDEPELSPSQTVARAKEITLAAFRRRVADGQPIKPSELKLLRELEAEGVGRRFAKSLEELGEALGCSKRTLVRWGKLGLPTEPDGTYDVERVREWRAEIRNRNGHRLPWDQTEERAEPAEPAETPVRTDRDYWETRYKQEQAQLTEIKRKKLAGELVRRVDVARLFAQRWLVVKTALLALPRSLPPHLLGLGTHQEMSQVIEGEVRAVIERFAAPLPRRFTEEDDGDEEPTEEDATP